MPLIQVKLMEKVFTPNRKKESVSKLTHAMVPIEGGNNIHPVMGHHRRGLQWWMEHRRGQAMTIDAALAHAEGNK